MKHLARWMICLALPANTAMFVAFIVLGVTVNPIFFALIALCYPLALLFIYLARQNINEECQFYDSTNAVWWKILKTILMPIVAAGALFMFHLLSITYRKMNEAVEDGSGFSISSIFRTLIGFVIYIVAGIVVYLIITGAFNDNVASDTTFGLLFFGGIVWILCHIVWDVMDLADKESDRYIGVKNVLFLGTAVLCVLFGIIMFINGFKKEVNFGNMLGLFSTMAAPLCISFAYYGVSRSGRAPQSRMTYFWGPIAMAIALLYSFLVAAIAQSGKFWTLIFLIITAVIYIVVIVFAGLPFAPTDGEYRSVYRNIAKEKRKEKANKANAYFNSKSECSGNSNTSSAWYSSKVKDVANQVSKMYKDYLDLSSEARLVSILIYPQRTDGNRVDYHITATLYVYASTPERQKMLKEYWGPQANKMLKGLYGDIERETRRLLASNNISFDNGTVNVSHTLTI